MTHERAPLALFGPEVSAALRALLEERVIGLRTAAVPTTYAGGELQLVLGAAIPADSIAAAPRLVGPAIDGVPSDRNGFVRCQADGSVLGLAAVYAAGDAVLPSEALPSIYRVFAASWASGHRPRVKCKRSPKWKKTGGIRGELRGLDRPPIITRSEGPWVVMWVVFIMAGIAFVVGVAVLIGSALTALPFMWGTVAAFALVVLVTALVAPFWPRLPR